MGDSMHKSGCEHSSAAFCEIIQDHSNCEKSTRYSFYFLSFWVDAWRAICNILSSMKQYKSKYSDTITKKKKSRLQVTG